MESFSEIRRTITVNDTAVIMTAVIDRHRISTSSIPSSPFFFAPGRTKLGFIYFKCNVTEIKVCIKTRQIIKRETKREP
jgi:hypothetical protein